MITFLIKFIIVSAWSYCFYKIGYFNKKLDNQYQEPYWKMSQNELKLAELIKEAYTKLE